MLLVIVSSISAAAQNVMVDTLPAAVKVSERLSKRIVTKEIDNITISKIVSPTGESDFISYIQTMPGVASGAEGTTAYYVRGGNSGGNLIQLDGVPVYGYSHLFGFGSAFPQKMAAKTQFKSSGFSSDDGNMTSSVATIYTSNGVCDSISAHASASNFFISGDIEAPLSDKASVALSVRLSPFQLEYGLADRIFDMPLSLKAGVYDLFGKVDYRFDEVHNVSFSFFGSSDKYRFSYQTSLGGEMGWNNAIFHIQDGIRRENGEVRTDLSFNHFSNYQGMKDNLEATTEGISLRGGLDELTMKRMRVYNSGSQYGIAVRHARFNPEMGRTSMTMCTLHGQRHWGGSGRLEARLALKMTAAATADNNGWSFLFNPEGSFFLRGNFGRKVNVEAAIDRTIQYYHTLEGIPVGWSTDIMIPSNSQFKPESAIQGTLALNLRVGQFQFKTGPYWKWMDNILYYPDASSLFSSSLAGWKENTISGNGRSCGYEFSCQKDGELLDCNISYTISKTERKFVGVNGDEWFPARFDRRHILNVSMQYDVKKTSALDVDVNALYTYQSGQCVTVAAGEYEGFLLEGTKVIVPYFQSENNFRLPHYSRLDVGCSIHLKKTKYKQDIRFGIYNVLNRHNIFNVFYNRDNNKWQSLSLLPIMPSFNYAISF